MREAPTMAGHPPRSLDPRRGGGRLRRRVLEDATAADFLPRRHASSHCTPCMLGCVHLHGHQQRRRPPRPQPDLLGVQSRRLLRLAAAARAQHVQVG